VREPAFKSIIAFATLKVPAQRTTVHTITPRPRCKPDRPTGLLRILIATSTMIPSWNAIMEKLAPIFVTAVSFLEVKALLRHPATTCKATKSKVSWALP